MLNRNIKEVKEGIDTSILEILVKQARQLDNLRRLKGNTNLVKVVASKLAKMYNLKDNDVLECIGDVGDINYNTPLCRITYRELVNDNYLLVYTLHDTVIKKSYYFYSNNFIQSYKKYKEDEDAVPLQLNDFNEDYNIFLDMLVTSNVGLESVLDDVYNLEDKVEDKVDSDNLVEVVNIFKVLENTIKEMDEYPEKDIEINISLPTSNITVK